LNFISSNILHHQQNPKKIIKKDQITRAWTYFNIHEDHDNIFGICWDQRKEEEKTFKLLLFLFITSKYKECPLLFVCQENEGEMQREKGNEKVKTKFGDIKLLTQTKTWNRMNLKRFKEIFFLELSDTSKQPNKTHIRARFIQKKKEEAAHSSSLNHPFFNNSRLYFLSMTTHKTQSDVACHQDFLQNLKGSFKQ